jgi:hypothetical protein
MVWTDALGAGIAKKPHSDKAGGLNGSMQHSLEVLPTGVSMAKFVSKG